MKDANIIGGDVVIIEQSQLAENGEKVVVRINHREVTLKTLRLDQDGVKLVPANPQWSRYPEYAMSKSSESAGKSGTRSNLSYSR